MASFGSFETEREVYSDPIYTVYSATRAGDSKSEFAIKVFSIQQTSLEPGTAETLQPLLEDIENSRSDAIRVQAKAASTSAFIAPVLLTGQDERGVWYATRFYHRSVNRIISGRVALNREALCHILRCVARGALDLKTACGRSHGGILPSNVQISKSEKLSEAEVVLSDPLPGGEEDAARFEISDLNAIGRIFLQLIAQRALEEHDFLILPILSSPEWTRVFGKDTDRFLAICNRLLDPNLSLADYTLEKLVADLAALEPKQSFSPKWAIAAAAAVLVLAGGFFVVKSLSGGGKKPDEVKNIPHEDKHDDTDQHKDNHPVTTVNPYAETWNRQFNERADLNHDDRLKTAFADVARNPAAFTNELMAWWDSRPPQMPDVSRLPGRDALNGAIDAELKNRADPDFSAGLITSIEARMKVKRDLIQTVSKLADRWNILSGGLASASNSWAQFNQPTAFIGTLFERDFHAALGSDAGIATLPDYLAAFSRAENEISRNDYNPPQKLRSLAPEKQQPELQALQAIVSGADNSRNYDAWRRDLDARYNVVDATILKNVKGWPPDTGALDAKIQELQDTLKSSDFPSSLSARGAGDLAGFSSKRDQIKTRTTAITSSARGAMSRPEIDQTSKDAAALVAEATDLSGKITTAKNDYIAAITAATKSRRKETDLADARKKIADGAYGAALEVCKRWPDEQSFQELGDQAGKWQQALVDYKNLFADGKTDILVAKNLPTNHFFQDIKRDAGLYAQAVAKFDAGDYSFASDTLIQPHAAEKPFSSLLEKANRENAALTKAQEYKARNDAAGAVSFINALDPSVGKKPNFQAVLAWAANRINRDSALSKARDLYAGCKFSEALAACANYQNVKDTEFDELSAKISADLTELNKLNDALQAGKYGEILSAESAYGNRDCFAKVIDQAKTEKGYLDKLNLCMNDSAPNLQGALDTLGAMRIPSLAGVTNKPPFQPILAWVDAQNAAIRQKQAQLQKEQQDKINQLDAELEGWLVKFGVIDKGQVHFPTYQNVNINAAFEEANNAKTKALGNDGLPAQAANSIKELFNNLLAEYANTDKKYAGKSLDQTGPWPGHKDTRRKDFERLSEKIKPFL